MGAYPAFVPDPSFTLVVCVLLFMFSKGKKTSLYGILASLVYAQIVKTFSCEITFDTKAIGKALKINLLFGIVIGENSEIANNATIFQNVTFGRKNLMSLCHISIENGVIISPGAVILGPVTTGGKAVVGANAVVPSNVLPHTTDFGIPARTIIATTAL